MNNKVFEVKDGSIYNIKTGSIVETMTIIIDKNVGLIKFGSVTDNLYNHYLDTVKRYKNCGLENMANDLQSNCRKAPFFRYGDER